MRAPPGAALVTNPLPDGPVPQADVPEGHDAPFAAFVDADVAETNYLPMKRPITTTFPSS